MLACRCCGHPRESGCVVAGLYAVLVAFASVLDTQHRRWHLILTTAVTISDAPLREGVPAALLRCDSPESPAAH